MNLGPLFGAFKVCLYIGLALGGVAVFMMWKQKNLIKSCTAQVDGIVTGCAETVSRHRDEDNRVEYNTTYKTRYAYSVEGVEYTGSVDWQGTTGDPIAVRYDPSNPQRHYVGKINVFWGWWAWFTFLGGFFLIVAIWILIGDVLPIVRK